jgi:hypothetical protein
MLNKKQMKRIVLAINASYLLDGAETHCVTSRLTDAAIAQYQQVQEKIAYGWLHRAGFTRNDDLSADGIIDKVLAEG